MILQTLTAQVGPPSVTCGDARGLDRRLRPDPAYVPRGEDRDRGELDCQLGSRAIVGIRGAELPYLVFPLAVIDPSSPWLMACESSDDLCLSRPGGGATTTSATAVRLTPVARGAAGSHPAGFARSPAGQ